MGECLAFKPKSDLVLKQILYNKLVTPKLTPFVYKTSLQLSFKQRFVKFGGILSFNHLVKEIPAFNDSILSWNSKLNSRIILVISSRIWHKTGVLAFAGN